MHGASFPPSLFVLSSPWWRSLVMTRQSAYTLSSDPMMYRVFVILRKWLLGFRHDLIYCTCVYSRVIPYAASWETRIISCCPDNTGPVHSFRCGWHFQQCTTWWLEVGGLCHTNTSCCFTVLSCVTACILACKFMYFFFFCLVVPVWIFCTVSL
jgi:hypothetical protein